MRLCVNCQGPQLDQHTTHQQAPHLCALAGVSQLIQYCHQSIHPLEHEVVVLGEAVGVEGGIPGVPEQAAPEPSL